MSYFLPEGYVERLGAPQSFDLGGDDTWQDEVYKTAAALAYVLDLRMVVDIGTGSGFKLMKYFSDRVTAGVDLKPAVDILRQKYPNRIWVTSTMAVLMDVELVICADVLEHVDGPDYFLVRLKNDAPRAWFVISTPDRKLLERYPKWGAQMGPPRNGCHVREWSFDEFRQYMDQHFEVFRHFISNREQCTQCVIARLK